MEQLEIRLATAADRAAAESLLELQMQEHDLPIGGIGVGLDLALASGTSARLLIALRGGVPVGVLLGNVIVSVEKGGLIMWIEELYVAASARRTGVARALLRWVLERWPELRSLELEVLPDHDAATALYDSFGFFRVGRQRWAFDR
jgi:GNAT superfamily N-acetyltransferase